ncbi:hypothetical protein J1614_011054 [Plenodomus biglobosus]|nr:hypothetical protein J1614_011054 [Plenodomus biglobosus]
MAKVQGTCDARFAAVKDVLEENIRTGEELGASICVNVGGTNVVDIWGGHTSPSQSQPWTKDTIVTIWSSTKTITALATLICIDRGLLDPYEKVSKYWPEFGQNGKEEIEVRHLLCHAAGLSTWEEKVSIEDICDLDKATKLLEKQAPLWSPGTASGYHSWSMGHLLGGLVARVTGKSITQFIDDELVQPLGADFQLGAKEKDWPRIAEIVPPPPLELPCNDPSSVSFKTLMNPPMNASVANTEMWRRAELSAGNGHSNARGVATIMSIVSLGGTAQGKTFLSQQSTIDLIFKEQQNGIDLVLLSPVRFGIGFGLTGKESSKPWIPEGRVARWGGWGGSIVIMDVDRGITIAYMMNKMKSGTLGDERSRGYVDAVYKALDTEA